MRQIVLDTETTGLEAAQGHRIIEIGCVELLHRRLTGRSFHRYLNPGRDIDAGAQAVHGLSRARLAGEPEFAAVAPELIEFLAGAELVIHNAPFDVGFLDAELRLIGYPSNLGALCPVLDTLALAKRMHPGQRNSLDALCKRYGIDNTQRSLHGALLDARILADVYLAMTGGQATLTLGGDAGDGPAPLAAAETRMPSTGAQAPRAIPVVRASQEEQRLHDAALARLDKASGGATVWRRL
jgi:DNA polymerase-3 subunit epsilon